MKGLPYGRTSMNHWIYWIKKGFHFKYPLCCIILFCIVPQRWWKKYNPITNKDGYVPCPVHQFILLSKYKMTNKSFRLEKKDYR